MILIVFQPVECPGGEMHSFVALSQYAENYQSGNSISLLGLFVSDDLAVEHSLNIYSAVERIAQNSGDLGEVFTPREVDGG